MSSFKLHRTAESVPEGSAKLLQFPQTAFQKKWRDRCLNENAIHQAVYAANVQFLSGQALYEALNWKIPNKAGFGGNRPWNEGAAFIGEDGEPWQIRLDVPRVGEDGKVQKYESIKGRGSLVFRPSVPPEIRVLMREKWGVDVPMFGDFWAWFDRSDEAQKLPLVATEGGTKCLSILSLGIPSISFYGVNSAFQSKQVDGDPQLLLPKFRDAARGKAVYFAFDSDTKTSAKHAVHCAIVRTGKAVKSVASSVHVLQWASASGKGADDYISANGGAAFFDLITKSEDFSGWVKKDAAAAAALGTWTALSARAIPDLYANAVTMSGCNFRPPELGEALLFLAAMGIGKTHTFGEIKAALQSQYPDLICDAIGHRNNLLKQTAMRLQLLHIHTLACGARTAQRMEHESEMAYCVDSLWRRFDTLIGAIADGRKVLLILDEVDAFFKHLLTSTTLRPARRIEVINKLGSLLKAIAGGGGWIIGGEANLTALSVKSLRWLSGNTLKIIVAQNQQQPSSWQCFNVSAIGENGVPKVPTAATQKKATIAILDKLIAQGQRVMLLTTSQSACEDIEGIYRRRGIKTERIDSKTSPEKWQQGVLQNAGPELRSATLGLFIGSPSIECGLSIEGTDLFDAVVLYASGLEPFTAYQMLGRLRDASVPRYIVAAEYSQTAIGKDFDSEKILNKWRKVSTEVTNTHGFAVERQTTIAAAHELAAEYEARSNAGEACLRAALLDLIRADGHIITPMEIQLNGSESKVLKEAKKIERDQRIQDWTNADDSGITADSARMKLRDADLKWLDKVVCLKAIDRDRYGDLVDQPSWVGTYWADELQGKRLKNAILTATEFQTEGMASESDRRAVSRQIEATGTIWGRDIQGRDRKIQVLKKLNLEALLSLVGSDAHIHKEHHLVRSVFKSALSIADEVKSVLGLTVKKDSQPMGFVSDLLKTKLGYSFEDQKIRIPDPNEFPVHQKYLNVSIGVFSGPETSKPENTPSKGGRPKGPKTVRVNAYKLVASPHHAEMMAALVEHHNDYKPDLEIDKSPLQPGRSIVWGKTATHPGEVWTVSAVSGRSVWLSEGPNVRALMDCLRMPIETLLSDCRALYEVAA